MSNGQNVLLKTENLQKYFPLKKSSFLSRKQRVAKANKNITLEIFEGETLGIVGESGCGKSTFGRTLIQLYEQTGGSTLYYGVSLFTLKPAYVRVSIAAIPKQFPDYVKAQAEFEQKVFASLEDKQAAKNALTKKYGNMLRLAGDLLCHDNLKELAHELLHFYDSGLASERLLMIREYCRTKEDYQYLEQYADTGVDLGALRKREMKRLRKDLQIIFQNPYSSLDPRMNIGQIIKEGIDTFKTDIQYPENNVKLYVQSMMEKCGLKPEYYDRFPHQFSGGQRQRVSIARSLAINPKFVVCDEAVSALDVSIQAQILTLLKDLKAKNNLTYLFITHDLGVVRYISDRIGVMYFGNLVEIAPTEALFTNPCHPYTKQLLDAIPNIEFEDSDCMSNPAEQSQNLDIMFNFIDDKSGDDDHDWVEISPGHFVLCTLKDERERTAL